MTQATDPAMGPDEVEFPFPFPPYSIQTDFMRNLYSTLEGGKIGIFESPTGTGKSLSLICGALTWLRDFGEQQRKELEDLLQGKGTAACESLGADSGSMQQVPQPPQMDWLLEFDAKKHQMDQALKLKVCIRIQDRKTILKERRESLERHEERLNGLRSKARAIKKRKLEQSEEAGVPSDGVGGENGDDDDVLVAEYTSDGESADKAEDSDDDEDKEENNVTKIYYCSRTHSQLSQFVHEVKKSPFGNDIRLATLGSRQNLCINPAVKKLKSLTLINEKCLEMQKKKRDASRKGGDPGGGKRQRVGSSGCPYYNQNSLEDFKDRVAMEPLDIEQLVHAGKDTKACPYYGTRHSVPLSQIVVLPYNILLHKSTREACGIKLDGNIVIIDEAHNLLETISNVHSMEITGSQVNKAYSQLSQYMHRYKSRLKAKNLMYIKQILHVLQSFITVLGGNTGSYTKLFTINDFLFSAKLDNINFFKLQMYCQKSKISHKLNGFVEKKMDTEVKLPSSGETQGMSQFLQQIREQRHQQKQPVEPVNPEKPTQDRVEASSPLMNIQSFLQALTNADKDGRVVVYKKDLLSQSSMKFLLLNPAVHFRDVVSEARSVVIAGGTMQPVDEFKHQLFSCASVPPERILEFSCGLTEPVYQCTYKDVVSEARSVVIADGAMQPVDEFKHQLFSCASVPPERILEFPVATIHFRNMIFEALSVVIVGGTMRPANEHQLFSCASVPPERILEFSYGHVIPADHLLPISLSTGPSGRQMDFTYQSRNKPEMLDELGRILVNLSAIIPAGLVCFFPSYDYADHVYSYWEKTGVLSRLEKKKAIFQEPKKAAQVEQVLGQYANVIKKTKLNSKQAQNGALLLSVVGGKMSEGINFSDDMGRCVVMVGLPYANITSPELKEKMDYLNATMPPINGRTAGQVHYDNICMKAVNQSIGRAIRHKGDYATIVLVDHRYGRPSTQAKLPGWISKHLHTTDKFGRAFALIRQFFVSKNP